MARLITLQPVKTYATRENAERAVTKKIGGIPRFDDQVYFIQVHTDGRFFPVFVGERAVHKMLHFHFNVVA